jgi:hypothetical protein
MHLLTLKARGTDVAVSALELGGRSFKLDDLYERYGRLRRGRGEVLAENFQSSVRNELQRLSSDCLVFGKEKHELDLFALKRPGVWAIRDEARPKLITAANEAAGDLLKIPHRLLVPMEFDRVGQADAINVNKYNHIIGTYAQTRIMEAMRQRGARVMGDVSTTHSYDFWFMFPGRTEAHQIMESKGTRGSKQTTTTIALSEKEHEVLLKNRDRYWLGVVYDIEIVDGVARGGSAPFITEPPIDKRWQLTKGFRWRWIDDVPDLWGAPP